MAAGNTATAEPATNYTFGNVNVAAPGATQPGATQSEQQHGSAPGFADPNNGGFTFPAGTAGGSGPFPNGENIKKKLFNGKQVIIGL